MASLRCPICGKDGSEIHYILALEAEEAEAIAEEAEIDSKILHSRHCCCSGCYEGP